MVKPPGVFFFPSMPCALEALTVINPLVKIVCSHNENICETTTLVSPRSTKNTKKRHPTQTPTKSKNQQDTK